MTNVVPPPRLASAFAVQCGPYGAVCRHARQRGVSRQWVYREAALVCAALDDQPCRQENARLRQQLRDAQAQLQALTRQLHAAVVLDDDKQAEFASLGQARGISLPDCHALLAILHPGRPLSVASLGRRTKAAAAQAGPLLEVLDAWAQPLVREAAGDEIYVSAPVLMAVEPASLCWLTGRLSAEVNGAAWAQELQRWPHLELFTRDGGSALAKGVALRNAQRQQQEQAPVVDQGDHWHALRGGHTGVRQAEKQARTALTRAEAAERAVAVCARRGQARTAATAHARAAWRQAEQAMDHWGECERLWQQTKEAVALFTPTGELNTPARAQAALAAVLPQLSEGGFAKTKRALQQPEMLSYLQRVDEQLAALPYPAELKQAAVRQEGLRRRPEALPGGSSSAGALRGVLLVAGVLLGRAGAVGEQTVAAVRQVLARAYRASSLVECMNSVLRMQQARHRKLTQGLLDLKRLYWNSHTFRTGRRRGTTPYERLGVPWPKGLSWWEVLKLTPEQLRDKLSTATRAA